MMKLICLGLLMAFATTAKIGDSLEDTMELEAIKDIVVDEVENRGSWHGPGEQRTSENENLGLVKPPKDRFVFMSASAIAAAVVAAKVAAAKAAAVTAGKFVAKAAAGGALAAAGADAYKKAKSCLLGNSKIQMRNGTTKAISDIQSGDVIVDGNLNPVTVKAVVTNYLYDRPLFEFKNGPVFTDEHLFYADLEKNILAAASPESLVKQVPQMKSWDIRPINNTKKLLQYKNGQVSPQTFDFHPYHKMDSNTPVYFLITSGKDGSYIANNFVARHELPNYEDWPFTYATMELVIQKSEIENPVDSIEDDDIFNALAVGLVSIWKSAIEDHVFDPKNIISIDPVETVATIQDNLTPSKLKLAEDLMQLGSEILHEAFSNEIMTYKKKLSLMKHIIDYSNAFFVELRKKKQG